MDRLTVSLYEPKTHTLNREVTKSYGGYSQGNYRITDKLTATIGLRYTLDDKTFDDDNYTTTIVPNAANLFDRYVAGKAIFTALSDHPWGAFTPKFGLDYQLTPLIMAYASYAEAINRAAKTTVPPMWRLHTHPSRRRPWTPTSWA